MRVSKIIAALVVALLAIYLAAAPYITVYQIKSAAKAHDGAALSQHIDFASVRQSLKDQMNAKFMRELGQKSAGLGEPFAVFGLALAGVVVDKAVDVYVTPSGVTQLMQGHKPQPAEDNAPASSQERKPLADATMGYQSLNSFVVKAPNDDAEITQFVLSRRGLGGKLTEIIVPMD